MLLFVLGTVQYIERDFFHSDESLAQPIIEIASVFSGTCLALGAAAFYRARLRLRMPYLLLLGTLLVAIASSMRSWYPLFSFTRGVLLVMISASSVVLLQTYGLGAVLRSVMNAYVVFIIIGLVVGLAFPDNFPLLLRDPGEGMLRARLHLFKLHPIALADSCVISLIMSVLLAGRWVRVCRAVFLACLFLTVARASIILGLPLDLAAEWLFAGHLLRTIKRLSVVRRLGTTIVFCLVTLVVLRSDWSTAIEIRSTVSRLVDATVENVELSGRTVLWSTLIDDLSFDNVYGYGVNGARYYLRSVNPRFSHSHNSALETIYMAGFAGLVVTIAALGMTFAACFSRWRSPEMRVITLALCYIISAGMMNPSWYDTSSLIALSIISSGPWLFMPMSGIHRLASYRRLNFARGVPQRA
jgi:O-antigen ligase